MLYIAHILIILNIYIILVQAANLTIGMSNLLTLCQAAFYGIGAYLGTLFLNQFNISFLAIAAIVMTATGVTSLIISFASIRLKGDFFIFATLAFQMIVFTILNNWTTVTGGPNGISGIPSIKIFGLIQLKGIYPHLIFSCVVAATTILLMRYIIQSPFGRTMRAIRTDEITVVATGRNASMYKTWAFFISAALSGVAGILYASYIPYIDPSNFTLDESIFILSALFIGGIGNIKGPLLGAVFVVVIPELLRFVGLPKDIAADLRQIIYGLSLIIVMFCRPQGIAGVLQPSNR